MKIFGEWNVYVEREKDEGWPDLWGESYERWLRPHKLILTFRQRNDGPVELVFAGAECQKRWANSKRLTDPDTCYLHTIWEVDGPVPEWIRSYSRGALDRIRPVIETTGQGFDKVNARILDDAANTVSGLDLYEIGTDGHVLANRLWKISAYLRRRSSQAATAAA